MEKYTKRAFLKTAGTFGLYLAGANLPIWAINNFAYANTDSFSFKLKKINSVEGRFKKSEKIRFSKYCNAIEKVFYRLI